MCRERRRLRVAFFSFSAGGFVTAFDVVTILHEDAWRFWCSCEDIAISFLGFRRMRIERDIVLAYVQVTFLVCEHFFIPRVWAA